MNEPSGGAGDSPPQRFTVGEEEHGLRLDRFLAARLSWRSRTSVERLVRDGKVTLSGRSARPSRKVHAGEDVVVQLPKPRRDVELEAAGGELPLEILYEDRWLLAVDKPPGIPVHPGGRLVHLTVVTELARRYAEAAGEDAVVPKLCHRLDLETSGVLLLGKDDGVLTEIGRQLQERETHKEYLAIVHGFVAEDSFEIDAPIGPAIGSEIELKRSVRPDGEHALTGVSVERRYRDFTLLRIRLHTGRRHQIRVHLQHRGHPIAGDKLYGLDEAYFLAYHQGRLDATMLRELKLPRQALHATRLMVNHPIENRVLDISSPLPQDLVEFLGGLEPIHRGL